MLSEDYSQAENAFKQLPYYKAIVKSFIRKQIQGLLEELSHQTGEESIILSVNVQNGTLSHQGSGTAKGFLESRNDIKTDFLSYCISCNTEQFQKEFANSTRNNRPKRSSYTLEDQIHTPVQVFHNNAAGESTPNTAADRENRVTQHEDLDSKDPISFIADAGRESERHSFRNQGYQVSCQGHSTTSQGQLAHTQGQSAPGQEYSLTSQDSMGSSSDQADFSSSSAVGGSASAEEVVVKVEPGTEDNQDSGHSQGHDGEAEGLDGVVGTPWGQDQSGFGPMPSSSLGQNKNRTQVAEEKDKEYDLEEKKDIEVIVKEEEITSSDPVDGVASKFPVQSVSSNARLPEAIHLPFTLTATCQEAQYPVKPNVSGKRKLEKNGIDSDEPATKTEQSRAGAIPGVPVLIKPHPCVSTEQAHVLLVTPPQPYGSSMSYNASAKVVLARPPKSRIGFRVMSRNKKPCAACGISQCGGNRRRYTITVGVPWPDSKDFPESLLTQTPMGTGDEIVSCVLCGRLMASRSLKTHLMSHQSIKRFECDFCDRKFTHKTTLTNHRRLHTGEKPYKCEMCDVAFHALSGLAQHRQSKHSYYGSSLSSLNNFGHT